METCSTCKFFGRPAAEGQPGLCRRNPPSVIVIHQQQATSKAQQINGAPPVIMGETIMGQFPPVIPNMPGCGMHAPVLRPLVS